MNRKSLAIHLMNRLSYPQKFLLIGFLFAIPFDLGFQIGLDADIAEFVAEKIVHLHSGEVVVLYTDGITEAKNMDKLLYGLDRLIEVIEINWQRSAAEIRHAVIKDVRSHIDEQKVFDDITLLLLKQK